MATSPARWALLLAIAALLALALPSLAAPVKLTINGYVQGRFTETFGNEGAGDVETPSAFDIKRAYLWTNAVVDDHVGAWILISLVPSVQTLEAYGSYTEGALSTRLGLSRIPFGYEIPITSAKLITLERSQVMQKLLYPGTFDRGIFGYYMPKDGLNLSMGITNGRPVAIDYKASGTPLETNNSKNFIARAGYRFSKSDVGFSVYTGDQAFSGLTLGAAAVPLDSEVTLLAYDLETKFGPFTILSEGLSGELNDIKTRGVYVTAAFQNEGSPSQPYIRYDVFDPNKDVSGDYFRRLTLGYNHFLNPTTKLTAEYEWISDDLQPDLTGRITGQYQVIF